MYGGDDCWESPGQRRCPKYLGLMDRLSIRAAPDEHGEECNSQRSKSDEPLTRAVIDASPF